MIKLLTIFPILFILFLQVQSCETGYDFGSSSCTFYVNHTDSTCNNFTFSTCTFGRIEINNWTTCTQLCCDLEVTYSQNIHAIRECQDYLNKWIKPTIIFLSLLVGVPLTICICVVGFICCRNCIQLRLNRNN